jgi:hypothetical protein
LTVLSRRSQKKDREKQRKSDSGPHVHQLPLLTFWIQSRMLTCDFKDLYIHKNETELLRLWTPTVHLVQNLIEDEIGSNNARCARGDEYSN